MEATVQTWSSLPISWSINKGWLKLKCHKTDERGVEGDGYPIPEVAVSYLALWMQIQRATGTPVGT